MELPPAGKKFDLNLLNGKDFIIPNLIDRIPNLPVFHKLLTQAKKNAWIIAMNVEETSTYQRVIDELQRHHIQCGKI